MPKSARVGHLNVSMGTQTRANRRAPAKRKRPTDDNEAHTMAEQQQLSISKRKADIPALRNVSKTLVAEMQQEIQCLENIIAKLEEEKNAFKQRLDEATYHECFRAKECREWLESKYEFEGADGAEQLAAVFESYVLRREQVPSLPHGVTISDVRSCPANGSKTRGSIATRLRQERSQEDAAILSERPPVPRQLFIDGTFQAISCQAFMPATALEKLYAAKPWKKVVSSWSKPPAVPADDPDFEKVKQLTEMQQQLLEQHCCAIWERRHWIPTQVFHQRNPQEAKILDVAEYRRIQRQRLLRAKLCKAADKAQATLQCSALEKSVFSEQSVCAILRPPTLWIPEVGNDLVVELRQLDERDPDRTYHL